jgi:glyoxylase-like metal-dependent hydrolase (beta-lactamase superfamily II)
LSIERDGNTLDLGRHKLRFLETPHVHHWDSMVLEETTKSLFPADLFLQPGDQRPVVTENLGDAMNGGSLTGDALPYCVRALREQDFAWRGMLLGRELAPVSLA